MSEGTNDRAAPPNGAGRAWHVFKNFFLDAAFGPRLTGMARVIDGDTIEIQGTRVRLEGIDAPEFSQMAATKDGESHPVGQLAANHLRALIGGREVTARIRKHDIYGRAVSRCFCADKDLGRMMVANGWALATSTRYRAPETSAKQRRAGVWKTDISSPAHHRKEESISGPSIGDSRERLLPAAPGSMVRMDDMRLIGTVEISGGTRGWVETAGGKMAFSVFGKAAAEFARLPAGRNFNGLARRMDDGTLRFVSVTPARRVRPLDQRANRAR